MDHEKELMDAILGLDDDPILPDGWKEGDDLFAEPDQVDALQADESETDIGVGGENEGGESEADARTKDDDTSGESQSDDEASESAPPDGEEPIQERKSRVLKLKVNHNEEDLDIDAMSDEDLTALLQKGRAFDALKESENKKRYRTVYQEQLDAGLTEAAAKMVAQHEAGGKSYSLEDSEDTAPDSGSGPTGDAPGKAPVRDLKGEVEQLKALFPDVKEIPDEVAQAAGKGISVLTAYLAYREKQATKTAAALKKENQVLRQNAASAAKAPVRGVSGGGAVQKKEDPALKGFDMERW